MNSEWLTIQSFQRSQDLLVAINNLSIHAKLQLNGHEDRDRRESVAESKEFLAAFLEGFEDVLARAEQANGRPLTGIDPRLRQLAGQFERAKRERRRFRSRLFTDPISDIVALLSSTDEEDQKVLVQCLSDLRTLIEEHLETDTAQILEDF
jgi:hypothetical protein